jgi:hypothetical protein
VVKTSFAVRQSQFDNVLIGKLELVSNRRFSVLHSRVRLVALSIHEDESNTTNCFKDNL